jgi:hypothetical protein
MSELRRLDIIFAQIRFRQGADIHHSLLLIPLCAINGRSTMLCNEQLFFVWMFIFSSSVF